MIEAQLHSSDSLVLLMYIGSQNKNVYDTSFVKKRHMEKSITPGIFSARQKPIGASSDTG